MKGYDESKLIDLETIKDKSYFHNVFLTKTQRIFLDAEKDPNEGIKNFFPSKFKEYLPKDKQGVLLNAMQLYDYRNKIIKLFENKNIKSSMHALNGKSEPKEDDEAKKSEQKFDGSIGERIKSRRQKSDRFNEMITKKHDIINKDLFRKYFQFQSLFDMQKSLSKTQNAQKLEN